MLVRLQFESTNFSRLWYLGWRTSVGNTHTEESRS